MKKTIAKALVLLMVLTSATVFSFSPTLVDVVSAATNEAPAATPAPKPAATTTSSTVKDGGQVYTVVNGDVFWKIAKNNNLTLEQLKQLNPQITNANRLFVGQKINVGTAVTAAGSTKVYQGLGHTVIFRNGPGKDDQGVPVYSFTVVMADATFDANGKIINAFLDAYEVSTPNYDGESMPHFSGWPDKEGYNVTDHATAKVTGVSKNTLESATAEVNAWETKRERGDSYEMNPNNEWYKQMDFYQKWFEGKTVAEIKEWFAKNTTSAGRPIKATTTNQDDLNKLAKLTAAEKTQLADVVSGATMSLKDGHGDFLGALENAYNNRVEVAIPAK